MLAGLGRPKLGTRALRVSLSLPPLVPDLAPAVPQLRILIRPHRRTSPSLPQTGSQKKQSLLEKLQCACFSALFFPSNPELLPTFASVLEGRMFTTIFGVRFLPLEEHIRDCFRAMFDVLSSAIDGLPELACWLRCRCCEQTVVLKCV